MKVARNAAEMPTSGIREIVHRAIDRKDVVRLEIGESSTITPEHIIEAAAREARAGFTRYTASAGYAELRESIAEKLARVNRADVGPENIVVTAGAVQGLFVLVASLCEPGDAVLVPDPSWPNYAMICCLLGVRCDTYPCRPDNGFIPRPDDLERCLSRRTRLLVINSPNNPTGTVYSRSLMRDVAELAARRGLVLVSDEAYDELYFDRQPTSGVSLGAVNDADVVSVFSFSKTYAMTGWRVGYAVGPRNLIAVMAKLQEPTISCASSVSQRAALAALSGDQSFVATQRASLRERRDVVLEVLQREQEPVYEVQGAFYVLLDVSPIPSREFALELLERENIAVAPGSAFTSGASTYVRICYAGGGDRLEDAVSRIVATKKQLVEGGFRAPEGLAPFDTVRPRATAPVRRRR